MMTLQHTEEMLSIAAISAISAMAGAELANVGVHDYGIDGTIREILDTPVGKVPSLSIDYQLKATVNWEHKDEHIIYDLNVQNYNKMVVRLRDPCNYTPYILVLLCLPQEQSEWLNICPEYMVLKKCCYWYELPEKDSYSLNNSKIRIHIPTTNVLLPETVRQMFIRRRSANEL